MQVEVGDEPLEPVNPVLHEYFTTLPIVVPLGVPVWEFAREGTLAAEQ